MTELIDLIIHKIGSSIIVSMCIDCSKLYSVKDGEGNTGISHGWCIECGMKKWPEIFKEKAVDG